MRANLDLGLTRDLPPPPAPHRACCRTRDRDRNRGTALAANALSPRRCGQRMRHGLPAPARPRKCHLTVANLKPCRTEAMNASDFGKSGLAFAHTGSLRCSWRRSRQPSETRERPITCASPLPTASLVSRSSSRGVGRRFPARQHVDGIESDRALAPVDPARTCSPNIEHAIAAGAFHNDVVASPTVPCCLRTKRHSPTGAGWLRTAGGWFPASSWLRCR